MIRIVSAILSRFRSTRQPERQTVRAQLLRQRVADARRRAMVGEPSPGRWRVNPLDETKERKGINILDLLTERDEPK